MNAAVIMPEAEHSLVDMRALACDGPAPDRGCGRASGSAATKAEVSEMSGAERCAPAPRLEVVYGGLAEPAPKHADRRRAQAGAGATLPARARRPASMSAAAKHSAPETTKTPS
jgi:hypothetical protein